MTNKIEYPINGDLLKDQVILITGASDGIGKAVAQACAAHKATVILLGRKQKKLEACYDEIIANGHTEPLIYPCDLSELDDETAQQMAAGIYNEFGRLDGLLHNAAALGTISPYLHYGTELWKTIFDINVHAPFILSKTLIPLLKQSTAPTIIFTSSNLGMRGVAYWGAYAACKFANEGMAQTLGEELESDNIRVNIIDPGIVRTRMRKQAFPAEKPDYLPLPTDIVDAYLYLLSKDSAAVNGQRIDVWRKSA